MEQSDTQEIKPTVITIKVKKDKTLEVSPCSPTVYSQVSFVLKSELSDTKNISIEAIVRVEKKEDEKVLIENINGKTYPRDGFTLTLEKTERTFELHDETKKGVIRYFDADVLFGTGKMDKAYHLLDECREVFGDGPILVPIRPRMVIPTAMPMTRRGR